MEETANYEDLVGHALKILNTSLIWWLEVVLPEAGIANYEDWCFNLTRTIRKDRFLVDLDTNALLDIFLTGWDSQFEKVFNNRDPKGTAHDLRRHRNKWAHQSVFTSREAYRALDSLSQFLLFLSPKVTAIRTEHHKVNLMLEDVILEMAQTIDSRRSNNSGVIDVDGDVEMAGVDDDE